MYLCGFTLFLSLILNRTYVMMLELLHLEGKNRQLVSKQTSSSTPSSKESSSSDVGHLKKELEAKDEIIATLKKELGSKKLDVDTIRKQSEGLSSEYHNLGDKFTEKTGELKKDM